MFIDDYISEIKENINRTLKVTAINSDDNISFCDNKWIKLFTYILVEKEKVYIKKIEEDNSITFNTNVNGNSVFSLPSVVFFVGSQIKTSSEFLLFSNQYEDKVPFVWLNFPAGISSEEDLTSLETWHEQWSNIKLFFIGDMDRVQWSSKTTIEERTKIIKLWSSAFVKAVRFPYEIDDSVSYSYYPIFGKEDETGAVKDIIEGNLSGVGINFKLNVLQNLNCSNC